MQEPTSTPTPTPTPTCYFKNCIPNANQNSNSFFFTASQLASIYQFPAPNIALNKVIAVLSYGGGLYGTIDANGFLTNGDVQKSWAHEGISASNMPQVIVHLVAGATNNLTDVGGTMENTLDVSVLGSCCPSPNLTIILFIFPNTYRFTQAFQAMLDGVTVANKYYSPSIISVSWGGPEISYLRRGEDYTGELTNLSSLLQTATQNGINICVATGDKGSTDSTTSLSADFPSSCPYVTAVGGTTLICPSRIYDKNTNETVWNDGIRRNSFLATGGGISAFYAKPRYQTVAPGNLRCVPDIAFNADPDTGIVLYINGKLESGIGGTSMSAPMFAGFLAAQNKTTLPFINNILYDSKNAKMCFHDIILGSNYDELNPTVITSYTATIGYDCCSGLGSIIGNKLTTAIAGTPTLSQASILVKTISLNKTSIKLSLTTTYIFTATVTPANATNKTIKWSTSNNSVASVSQTGLVTALSKGKTFITARPTDGSNASISALVTVS